MTQRRSKSKTEDALMSDDRYFDKLKMPRSALDALVKAVPDQVVKQIVADHCRRAAPTPLVPSDSHSSCQGAGRDHGFGWTPGYILCPGFVDHIGERARRLHDPPHAGIDFVWDQPNVLPARLRYAVQLCRLNPPLTQRVLPACNLPAFDVPQNASLVQASRRCG